MEGEQEKKVPLAGAEQRLRGGTRSQVPESRAASFPLPSRNKLLSWASSLPVFSLPCSFSQEEALVLKHPCMGRLF